MREWQLGEVIADREFTAVIDGNTVPVHVRIGKPHPGTEGDVLCPYQVSGLGDDRIRAIAGIDSLQALCLTVQFIGSYLRQEQGRFNILWRDDEDLGLPALQLQE